MTFTWWKFESRPVSIFVNQDWENSAMPFVTSRYSWIGDVVVVVIGILCARFHMPDEQTKEIPTALKISDFISEAAMQKIGKTFWAKNLIQTLDPICRRHFCRRWQRHLSGYQVYCKDRMTICPFWTFCLWRLILSSCRWAQLHKPNPTFPK